MERALLGFDMLVTSGGASVGVHDLVRETQAKLRVEEIFWGVAVKPASPWRSASGATISSSTCRAILSRCL